MRAFEHHAADGIGIGRVADAVQHDLGHGALAVEGLGGRLVVDGSGKAIERAGAIGGVGIGHAERRGGGVGPPGHRHRGVDRLGAFCGNLTHLRRGHRLGALLQPLCGLDSRRGAALG